MSEKNLRLIILFIAGCFLFSFLTRDRQDIYYGDINVSSATAQAAEGLDLKGVGELLKQARNAEDLERLLNKKGGINNLDLNQDGVVDYIHVTEYGNDNAKGFSLTVEPEEGETQEVATIEVEKSGQGNQADIAIHGNRHIYGDNYYYRGSSLLTNFLIFSYLFSPHRMYYSPFHFGYYPSYYGMGYRTVPSSVYTSRARRYTDRSSVKRTARSGVKSNIRSPNAGKTAKKGIRASLRNPTRSQKSFQARTAKRTGRSTGFGRSGARRTSGFGRSSVRPTRPSVRYGGFGRGGGFGFGK